MKIINFIYLLIISYTIYFLSCAHPTNEENYLINNYKVYLIGKVLNKDGNPVPYAIAHLLNYNVLDTTDNNGIYKVTVDLDKFIKTEKAITDTSDTLQILKDGQIITTYEIINFIDTLPDLFIVQRNIGGNIASTVTQFNKIEAVVWNHSDTILKRAKLEYSLPTFSYGGFFYFVYTGTTQNYSVYVNVYNIDSLFIGRSDTIHFTSMAGDIQIPTIDPKNAIPIPIASADSAVSINDTIYLKGTASERFGGTVVKWEWDAGNIGTFIESTPDSSFIATAPSTANSAYPCVLKVTDNDGNVAVDTVTVNVLLDAPVCTASTTTPTVSINDTIHLQGTATDEYGKIVKWEWKIGNISWTTTSTGDTTVPAPSTDQFYRCSLRVTDDDHIIGLDCIEVVVGKPQITDIDGNLYHFVRIGNQIWTIENLRVTHFTNGILIPLITDPNEWLNDSSGARCYFGNDSIENAQKYGALYNWHAVNSGKLAPDGWHVATDADWTEFQNYLIVNGYNWDGSTTGNKMGKAMAAKTDWFKTETPGTVGNDMLTNNSSGFSALPGGYRLYNGDFRHKGIEGNWWTSTEESLSYAYSRNLSALGSGLDRFKNEKNYGFSVRLVRD